VSRRRGTDRHTGVLVVDKPAGITSHDVVDEVRRAARQRRVGHTGTLDPAATGILVVCLGRATRIARFLQDSTKTYTTTVRFGVETTTQDATGQVVAERPAEHVTREAVESALGRFRGEIEQVPPMVSAIKVGGERLHELARRGEEIEREARRITIYELTLDGFRGEPQPEADLTVTCSAGTYVRTLGHDLGGVLGVGAHLTKLRRTRNAGFGAGDAHSLEVVLDLGQRGALGDVVLSMDRALASLEEVVVDAGGARAVATGRSLPAHGSAGPYRVTYGGRLLAVYRDAGAEGRPEVVLTSPQDLPDEPSEEQEQGE
jgi:tRNA pseudouridine55 synthase